MLNQANTIKHLAKCSPGREEEGGDNRNNQGADKDLQGGRRISAHLRHHHNLLTRTEAK